jgi:hypothetical protein
VVKKRKQGDPLTESPLHQNPDVPNVRKWPAEIRRALSPQELFCFCCS